MPQPTWITPAGSLGTIPENIFYSVSVQAVAEGQDVFFRLIAGELPDGVQVNTNGIIEGVPKSTVKIQGVPKEVSQDITSKFAIRAYTVKTVGNQILIDRLADRTFSITVSGQDVPEFITPAGNVGTYYDGTEASVKIDYTDVDPDDRVKVRLISGELPPGLVLNENTGLISGVIIPLVGPPGTAPTGFDATEYDQYPFDFGTRAASKNFQFTLEVSDGKGSSARTFEIYVYAKSTMRADTTAITADNTFVTADVTPDHVPLLLTPEGDLGRVRADNFYAFKFDGIDFDGDPIEYSLSVGPGIGYSDAPYDTLGFDRGAFSLPPGLQLDPNTGWLYGYIPNQGVTEFTYKFAIQVKQKIEPATPWDALTSYQAGDIVSYLGSNFTALIDTIPGIAPTNTAYWSPQYVPTSRYYYFTLTIVGNIETGVTWLVDPDLGTINNGAISTLYVEAVSVAGRSLQYQLVQPGSRLPQGLTLQPSGNITGRVSFNTFALDGGTTTFDVNSKSRTVTRPTTFDSKYTFTVNAYSPESAQIIYQVASIIVTDGGSGYTSQPIITISPPPLTENSEQATAGVATIVGGKITAISLGNPGAGYTSPPTITITGGGGAGATAVCTIIESKIINAVSVFRTFTLEVVRKFNEPYETLYVKCMPPLADRALINQLIQNQDIIPVDLVYRADDSNFGVAQNVTYDHAYGLTASTYSEYMSSLVINHYWKNITLGEIKTARALDSKGNVLYEVVYSSIVDDLVNNQGQSVKKRVTLPYPVYLDDNTQVTQVYPNSLPNMRNQVIDTVGQVNPALPLWMTSKQENGQVLGFTPAWIIAYVKPGQGSRVAYNIREQFGDKLNLVDFKIDRYEINRSQTYDWDPTTQQWQPQPPMATTFDTYQTPIQIVGWQNDSLQTIYWQNVDNEVVFWNTPSRGLPQRGTIFDGNATVFITPADRWTNTDNFDKYLVFPRINILE